MNDDNRLPKADKFLKNRKKLKLWHRLLLMAGSLVVFITTYMLILPAITAEVGSIEIFEESYDSFEDSYDIEYEEAANEITDDVGESEIIEDTDSDESIDESNEDTDINSETDDADTETDGSTDMDEAAGDEADEGSDTDVDASDGEEISEADTGEETTEDVTEETTESTTEEATEETTEEANSSDDTDEGGGLSSSTTLADGTILTMTAVESEEEKSLFGSIVSLAVSSGGTFTYTGTNDDGSYVCEYDADTGDYILKLHIDFTVPQSSLETYTDTVVTESGYTYYYSFNLPTGVTLSEDLVYNDDGSYSVYNGYETGSTTIAFKYYFVPQTDDQGNVITDAHGNTCWTVVKVYSDSYLTGLSGADIDGNMDVEITITNDYVTNDGSIVINDSELNINITINAEEIEYSNKSPYEDLIIYKTATRSSDGTVTYTVRVFTTKGTGDSITITDVITNASSLSGLDADGLVSITYSTGTVGAVKNGSGLDVTGEDSLTSLGDLTYVDDINTTTLTSNYYYYDDDGNMVIVLDGLDEVADSTLYDSYYTTYNEYVIEYTYDVSPDVDLSYYVSNTATATTYDDTARTDLTDTSTATITVRGTSVISKSGSYSNDVITWTITVGDGSTDLSGYLLTDTMFGDVETVTAVTITDASGNAVDESDYTITYTYDAYGNVTGIENITFNSGTYYVIKYETEVSPSYESVKYTNDAELTPPDGKTSYDASAGVTVSGSSTGSLSKVLAGVETDDSGIYVLTWTSTFTIPESGIPAGSIFIDYVGSQNTDRYITYAQAQEIITALKGAWGEDNITDIYFSTYGANIWWTDLTGSDWIAADSLTDDGTVYEAFRFTIVQDIEYDDSAGADNTVSVTYSTTIDVSSVSESQTYTNTVYLYGNSSVYAQASYTYNANVTKYGVNSYGSPNSGDVSISTTEEGEFEISWIVRVILDDYGVYTVTDTLPRGVTLKSVGISNYNNYNYTTLTEGTETTLFNTLDFTYTTDTWVDATDDTVSGTSVIVTIEDNSDSGTGQERDTDTVYIMYTCSVDLETAGTYDYTNSVTVTVNGGTEYGSDDETIYVTYTEETEEEEEITKDYYFDQNNNVIQYTLGINPDRITYRTYNSATDTEGDYANYTGDEYADLTVTDVLTYYTFPSNGIARDVSLIMSSVHLYYAATNDDGTLKVDSDGNLIASSTELDSSLWSWTYTSVQEDYASLVTNTITLTVPNGVALVFDYQYLVTIITDDNYTWGDYSAGATNYAELSSSDYTISTSDPTKTTESVQESSTSASANGGAGYTIYKVNATNFAIAIPDTYFGFYVYNSSKGEFELIGTFVTNSNGQTGISGVYTDVEADSVKQYDSTDDSDDYLEKGVYYKITLSDGTTSYYVPADTMCYFMETEAAEYYKTDTTKYYFYFGKTVAVTTSSVTGYTQDMGTVYNIISSHSQYITNKHSSDYYANKTTLSVIKSWIDSEGNEYTKTDGSITFKLYRVYTDAETGEPTYAPGKTSGDQDDPSSGGTSSSTTVNINLYQTTDSNYSWWLNGSPTTTTVDVSSSADVVLKFSYDALSWTPTIQIKNLTTGDILDTVETNNGTITANGNGVWSNYENGYRSYTYTISDVGTSDLDLAVYCSDGNTGGYSVYIDGTYTEPDTTTTEATTESTTEVTTESTTETTTVKYSILFQDFASEFANDDYTDNTDTGYTYTDDDKYFTILGNLTNKYSFVYDVDGNGEVGSDETLSICLKMQNNNPHTTITFTNTEAGTLTMVFGNESNSMAVKIDGTTYTAVNNILTVELEAGTHTIERAGTDYIFYIEFVEGYLASQSGGSSSSSGYTHSFANGTSSEFYTISGSLSTVGSSSTVSYGSVTYNNEEINMFLKMNSKASISFDADEDGILYIVMTNAISTYANKTVGVLIDGVEYHASDTGETDSAGNAVYLLTARITAGSHTITRINGTEFQIYYISYVPDDYADAAVTDEVPYNEYAELCETVTISYSDAWSWSSAKYPLEYLDDDGNVLGYYKYYIVEVDDEGNYNTWYKNVSSDGISAGTMGLINQINEDSSSATSVAVQKEWLSSDGKTLTTGDDGVLDSITVDLYARLNIYSQYADEYDGGTDYSRYFTGFSSNTTLTDDSDGFFTVSGTVQASSGNMGEVTFTPATAEDSITTRYALKFESNGEVTFTSPAKSGILTLTALDYASTGNDKNKIGFTLTSPGGVAYEFYYDTSTGEFSGTYPGTLSNAVWTLAGNDTGVTITATGNSSPKATGIITFTIFTDDAGEWTITKNSYTQTFLLYMDYSYQYQYLAEGYGVYVGTYTIDSTTDWYKKITSLPLYIYDDDDNVIGYYSYYVDEVSPSSDDYDVSMEYTLAVDGNIIKKMELDPNNEGYIIVTYLSKDGGDESTYPAAYTSLTYDDDDTTIIAATLATTSLTAMSEGTFKITNKVKEISVVLPESGGAGTTKYMLAGLIMCVGAGLLLYIRSKKLRV